MTFSDPEDADPKVPPIVVKLTRRELIDATKAAIKETLDDQITEFGKWTLRTLGMALFLAGLIAVLYLNGWTHR
jgi:hypothetical protein